MIYLASPHNHPDEAIREERYERVMKTTARLLGLGLFVYSPIVHCHEMAKRHSMPNGFKFWQKFDEHVIGLCTEVWVLRLPGWEESRGVTSEIALAILQDKPVVYIDE